MLTRLKVSGFKNLDPVDVRFGPFNCVLGPNGVGKSNLFDAIAFLAALADKSLMEAAAAIRGTEGRIGDVRSLFTQTGGERAREMAFSVEMIVPETGTDDLGSDARASMTFLRYELRLRERAEPSALGALEVVHEQMEHINKTGAKEELRFDHSPGWRDSVIKGRRTVPYIETKQEDGKTIVLVGADSEGGDGGRRPRRIIAVNMPRTVLSTARDATDHRTLVLARREMMGWVQFQLEPSALRAPDPYNAPRHVAPNGAHLPAALLELAKDAKRSQGTSPKDTYQQVANRLASLDENIRTLRVDEDAKHDRLSIVLTDLHHTDHSASSLSDGTLRFLALTILEASSAGPSVLCLEEPENGIHPERIPAMIQLLRDIATDVHEAVGPDNPMRQVIINTHSPGVATCVPQDTLLIATSAPHLGPTRHGRSLTIEGLKGTWRPVEGQGQTLLPLISYLRVASRPSTREGRRAKQEQRIVDRDDVQMILFPARDEGTRP